MRFGPYELIDQIGRGGMAEVFRARMGGAEGFQKLVAIKRIHTSLSEDEEFVRMFVEEARIMAGLSHGNIAQVFDFGVIENRYYLAMELVIGHDLGWIRGELRQRGELLPIPVTVHICTAVCHALAYAHRKRDDQGHKLGIVHRDVSPQNVLVSFDGEVKLVDFGIAKVRSRAIETTHGKVKGKFGYMAPEQVRGERINYRADLFGLGIILHEMLTGERLFTTDSTNETIQNVLHAPVCSPSLRNPEIPPELDAVAIKALARELPLRYQSAEDMHADLARCAHLAGAMIASDISSWMKENFEQPPELLLAPPSRALPASTAVTKLEKVSSKRPSSFGLLESRIKAPMPEPILGSGREPAPGGETRSYSTKRDPHRPQPLDEEYVIEDHTLCDRPPELPEELVDDDPATRRWPEEDALDRLAAAAGDPDLAVQGLDDYEMTIRRTDLPDDGRTVRTDVVPTQISRPPAALIEQMLDPEVPAGAEMVVVVPDGAAPASPTGPTSPMPTIPDSSEVPLAPCATDEEQYGEVRGERTEDAIEQLGSEESTFEQLADVHEPPFDPSQLVDEVFTPAPSIPPDVDDEEPTRARELAQIGDEELTLDREPDEEDEGPTIARPHPAALDQPSAALQPELYSPADRARHEESPRLAEELRDSSLLPEEAPYSEDIDSEDRRAIELTTPAGIVPSGLVVRDETVQGMPEERRAVDDATVPSLNSLDDEEPSTLDGYLSADEGDGPPLGSFLPEHPEPELERLPEPMPAPELERPAEPDFGSEEGMIGSDEGMIGSEDVTPRPGSGRVAALDETLEERPEDAFVAEGAQERKRGRWIGIAVILLMLIAGAVGAFFLYLRQQQQQVSPKSPAAPSKLSP